MGDIPTKVRKTPRALSPPTQSRSNEKREAKPLMSSMASTTPEREGSPPVSMAGSNSEMRLELRSIAADAAPRYP